MKKIIIKSIEDEINRIQVVNIALKANQKR